MASPILLGVCFYTCPRNTHKFFKPRKRQASVVVIRYISCPPASFPKAEAINQRYENGTNDSSRQAKD
jgi:hypothetical protein